MDKTEAIKILKDFHDESDLSSVRTALETLHPELKESEDEMVRKCLINGMKFYYEDNDEATWGTEKFPMKVKDILSWLEKQGQPKPPIQYGITINGVEYELIEDNEADECTRCALKYLCNAFKYDALCNTIFRADIAAHHRFEKI